MAARARSINVVSGARRGSRDGAELGKDVRATRTYRFRRRVLCDCGRRMTGNPRHGIIYYRCHPANNNRGRPDKYEGHPATGYMRESLIMAEVNRFFAERVFGPQRREMFLAGLDQIDDTAQRERREQRQRLQRKFADATRKQDHVLRQAEDADPRDPFTQGLRQRYNDLEAMVKIGESVEEEVLTQTATCGESAGGSLCASCACPWCDSNAHWTVFETVASADWATGAR